MPFEIPNYPEASFPGQAEPDSRDFVALREGIDGNGVVSGCVVAAQGTPDMTVAVAAGSIRINSATVVVAGANVTVGAADPTNPRYDLIVANDDGSVADVPGTAAQVPTFPTYTVSSQVLLAAVYVPADVTSVGSTQIVDKRVIVKPSSGGGGTVDSVVAGAEIAVDATDPANPVVSVSLTNAGRILGLTDGATPPGVAELTGAEAMTVLSGEADATFSFNGQGVVDVAGVVSANGPTAGIGFLRLANDDLLAWRDSADSADYTLGVTASNVLNSTATITVDTGGAPRSIVGTNTITTVDQGAGTAWSGSSSGVSSSVVASASDMGVVVSVVGDGVPRLAALGDGTLQWGSGAGVADTNLYRSAADVLKTDDSFVASRIAVNASAWSTVEKVRVNTPTTADTIANVMLAASAAGARPLTLQMAVTPTVPPFQIQTSAGSAVLSVSTTGVTTGADAVGASDFVTLSQVGSIVGAYLPLAGGTMTGTIGSTQGASTSLALSTMVTADANPRFTVDVSGKMTWGAGSGAVDTNLYRLSAGNLATDSSFFSRDGGDTYASLAPNGVVTSFESLGGTSATLSYNGLTFTSDWSLARTGANVAAIASGDRLNVTSFLAVGSTGSLGTVEKFRVNTPTTVNSAGNVHLAASSSGAAPLIVQGAPSQSSALLRAENSGGTLMFGVGSAGSITAASGAWAVSSAGNVTATGSGINQLVGNGGAIQLGSSGTSGTGAIRLLNASLIAWRNAAATNDYTLGVDSSDRLKWSGNVFMFGTDTTLQREGAGYLNLIPPTGSDGRGMLSITTRYGGSGVSNRRGLDLYASNDANATGTIEFQNQGSPKAVLQASTGGSAYLYIDTAEVIAGAANSTLGTVEKFRVNTPTTVDNTANAIFSASATTSKPLVIQGVASQTGNLLETQVSAGTAHFGVTAAGLPSWVSADTQTTVGAAGGGSALPVTPTGYLKVDVSGSPFVVPYYAAS